MNNTDVQPNISDDDLAPVVKAICGGKLVGDWVQKPIGAGIGLGTVGIYRIEGTAETPEQTEVPWSVVLKIVDIEVDRMGLIEYQLAASDSLQSISQGLRPAICYGTAERGDTERWIWIEDLADALQPPWSISQFLSVARDVGIFHGISSKQMPEGEWDYVGIYHAVIKNGFFVKTLESLEETSAHPVLGAIFGSITPAEITELFKSYEVVGDRLGELQTVFAHNDCHADNVFPIVRNGKIVESVAIDWATAGLGPIGEDAGNLAIVGAQWLAISVDEFSEFEKAAFEQYLDGLLSIDPTANVEDARTGYLGGLAYWGFAKMMMRARAGIMFPQTFKRYKAKIGLDEPEIARRWGLLTDKMYPLAVELLERIKV